MKRTITLTTLIVCSLFGSSARASHDSRLHLDLFTDGDFVVHMDDIRYNMVRGGVDIGGLSPGTHYLRVVEVFRGRYHHGRSRTVLYQGSINIPFRSAVFARLTPSRQLRITEIRSLHPQVQRGHPYRSQYRYDHHRNHHGYDYRDGYRNDDRYRDDDRDRYRDDDRNHDRDDARDRDRDDDDDGYRDDDDRRGGRSNNSGNRRNGTLSIAKSEMMASPFDSHKRSVAEAYVRNNSVTASEVTSMMNLMQFENNKLSLAKMAYSKTIDKENYGLVKLAFTYDSSVRALDRFIASQGR